MTFFTPARMACQNSILQRVVLLKDLSLYYLPPTCSLMTCLLSLSNPNLLLNDFSLISLSNPYLLLNDPSLYYLPPTCSLMTRLCTIYPLPDP